MSVRNARPRARRSRHLRPTKAVDVVVEIRRLAREEERLNARLATVVRRARRENVAWSEIADALGVSRQAAWEYFARRYQVEVSHRSARPKLSESDAMKLALRETKSVRRGRRRA